MEGWIKLHRKLLDWRWFSDGNTLKVFLYILLQANHEKKSWKGIEILPGQMIFGRERLSETLAISEQSLRTIITRLKSTSEITTKSTNKYTVVTVVNWESYQNEDTKSTNKSTNKLTNHQPTTNQQLTTPKELKELKEEKKENYTKEKTADSDFEKFWNLYDKKVDRPKTEKIWEKLNSETRKLIFQRLPAYIQATSDKQFRKNPVTYLNNQAWENEVTVNQPNTFQKGLFSPKSTSMGKILNAD